MSDNVIQLPRHRDARPAPGRLGLYLRVGFNQHTELLEVMAGGERDFHGLIFEAQATGRFQQAMRHFAKMDEAPTAAQTPQRRSERSKPN